MGFLDRFSKSPANKTLDDATTRGIYADFNNTYNAELEKAKDDYISRVVLPPGETIFYAMGAAKQHFATSSETEKIRQNCLAQVASRHHINRGQLDKIIAQGKRDKW